jgi:hypothetical protein
VLTGKMSAVLEPMYACCAVVTGKMSAVLEPMYVLIFVVFLCVAFRVLRLFVPRDACCVHESSRHEACLALARAAPALAVTAVAAAAAAAAPAVATAAAHSVRSAWSEQASSIVRSAYLMTSPVADPRLFY